MIVQTDTFWSYIINEDNYIIDRAITLLTKSSYDYVYQTTTYIKMYVELPPILGHRRLLFPTGLVKHVSKELRLDIEYKQTKSDLTYSKEQILDICQPIKDINPSFEVREYQIEAVLASANQFQSLIDCSTGSGKTSIMSILCMLLKDDKILIINNNNFILQQIYDRLVSLGISTDDIGTGCTNLQRRIQICSTQTLHNRIKSSKEEVLSYLQEVNTIIHDEAQHWQAITGLLPIFYTNPENLRHLVGYSGSPFRNPKSPYTHVDDVVSIGIMGEPAYVYRLENAVEDNKVSQSYVYFINYKPKTCNLPDYAGYNSLYSYNIMKNENRNRSGIEMIKYLNKNGIKTLVLFNKIDKHGLVILKELKKENINSYMFCGGGTIYEYNDKLKCTKRTGDLNDVRHDLNNGYNIILGSSVFYEGCDIPELQAVLIFCAGKSPITLIQAMGRACRKKAGVNKSLVIDFNDLGSHYIFSHQYNKRRQIINTCGVKELPKVDDFFNLVAEIKQSKENFINSKK